MFPLKLGDLQRLSPMLLQSNGNQALHRNFNNSSFMLKNRRDRAHPAPPPKSMACLQNRGLIYCCLKVQLQKCNWVLACTLSFLFVLLSAVYQFYWPSLVSLFLAVKSSLLKKWIGIRLEVRFILYPLKELHWPCIPSWEPCFLPFLLVIFCLAPYLYLTCRICDDCLYEVDIHRFWKAEQKHGWFRHVWLLWVHLESCKHHIWALYYL